MFRLTVGDPRERQFGRKHCSVSLADKILTLRSLFSLDRRGFRPVAGPMARAPDNGGGNEI